MLELLKSEGYRLLTLGLMFQLVIEVFGFVSRS